MARAGAFAARRGRRARHERPAETPLGRRGVQVVPAAGELHEAHAFDSSRERPPVFDGNDRVGVAPENGDGRELPDLVRVKEERVALPSPVHQASHRPGEGAGTAASRVHRAEVVDMAMRQPIAPAVQRQARTQGHEGLPEQLDDERDRGEPQDERDFLAQTARRREHETPNARATAWQEHEGDPAPERVPDDVDLLEPQVVDPGDHDVRVPCELVPGVGPAREAVPRKIEHEDAPVACEPRGNLAPREVRVVETMQKHHRRALVRFAIFDPVERNAADDVRKASRLGYCSAERRGLSHQRERLIRQQAILGHGVFLRCAPVPLGRWLGNRDRRPHDSQRSKKSAEAGLRLAICTTPLTPAWRIAPSKTPTWCESRK